MKKDYFDILQITDIHFREQTDGTIYGIETQGLFEQTLAQIQSEIQSQERPIDLLLATGDISQDGSLASYQRFLSHLKPLDCPKYYLQGNHDYNQPMLDVFGVDSVAPCDVKPSKLDMLGWRVLMLNSSVEDQVGGHFGKDQLDYLTEALKKDTESPTLIAFHHHPMPIDCEWLDQQVIEDNEAFFELVDQYSNIQLCIYGHVHQDRVRERNGVQYIASPSTCAQFKPEMKEFTLDELAPAYRWIRCYADGRFSTEVRRLENFKFPLN